MSCLQNTSACGKGSITKIILLQDLSRKIKDYGEKTRFRKRIVSKWEVRYFHDVYAISVEY